MNIVDMLSMIYYVLEAYYADVKQSDAIHSLLCELCHFTWRDLQSADPVYITNFRKLIKDNEVPVEGSYALAREFVKNLDKYKEEALEAFDNCSEMRWNQAVKEYLIEYKE